MSFLAAALVLVLCGLVGHGLAGFWARPSDTLPYRIVLALIFGSVALYLGQWLLYGLGLPWSRATLLLFLTLAAVASVALGRLRQPAAAEPLGWGWGDVVTLIAVAAFGVTALQLWSLNPDFVYHWGIKAAKFHLAGGFDADFLTQTWDRPRHPEYPLLYPAQLAAVALVGGGFDERALMLPTVLLLAALGAAARQVLHQQGVAAGAAQATMALLGLATAAFGVGYLMAGSPDWFLALAPLAAWPLMARQEGGIGAALALGGVAALAAGAKLEGLVLAAALVVAFGLTRPGARPADRLRAIALAALPVLLVVLPWCWFNAQHGIDSTVARGPLSLDHLGTVVSTLPEALGLPEWHGFGWLLLALPLLVVPKATRVIALVCLAQLGFYVLVYLSLPFPEPEQVAGFIRSNAGRLAFHVLPTVIVACGVAIGHGVNAEVSPRPQISPGGFS